MNDLKAQASDRCGMKGEYFFFSLPADIKEGDPAIMRLRKFYRSGDEGLLLPLMRAGIVREFKQAKNIIPLTGRAVIARVLAGDTIYSGRIEYGALGSGSTAFDENDTQLNTEVFRKLPASRGFDDSLAVSYADWLITAGDVGDQTFEEFGAFIGGSGTANSGQAFSLLITGGWVKSGAIFIGAKYTITSAT